MDSTTQMQVLIDRFIVPAAAQQEFQERMQYNLNFIGRLSGFISHEVYQYTNDSGSLIVVTIAKWQNHEAITAAKAAVLAEYERIGFKPADFYNRLHIQLERGIFTPQTEH